MPYTRTTWQDSPSTATPVDAANLNNIEQGVVDAQAQNPPAGGGTGQVLAKSSATDYDMGWVTPSTGGGGSGLSTQIDVTQAPYNAVGDGVTDDTTAIQDAINAGGVTFFPAGKTFLVGKLTLKEATVLQGVNSGYIDQDPSLYSIIKLKNATNDHLIDVPVTALGVQIYDLQLDGNKANQTTGTCNVINCADTASYTQTQMTVQRCYVKNGRSYGIYGGNERGGIKILQTRVYGNSNSTDQLDGLRLMAADNMVAFCSLGNNGGNGLYIGSGPSAVFSNGIWGNWRGITVGSTITEVSIMMNGIDTNQRQGVYISANCDAVTLVGNIFHTNSQAATNTYPHIEVASTKGTISLVSNQSGPLDSGSTGTPTQLIKCDASCTAYAFGNVASSGSTTNGVTNDWTTLGVGADGDFVVADSTQTGGTRWTPRAGAIGVGISGTVGATVTDGADFLPIVPAAVKLTKMKVSCQTAPTGAMVVQLRRSTDGGATFSNVTGFSVTFTSGNHTATVDPTDVSVNENDVLNISVSTGSGTNLLCEVVIG